MGRAGRDGCEAACTAFLDDGDFLRLRSLAHADGTDQPNVHSFLEAVFAKPVSAGGTKVLTGLCCTASWRQSQPSQRAQAADQPNVHGFWEGVFALSVSAGGANALTRPTGGTHYRVPWTL